ncbi:F-box/LRR-repeat protein fbxl-1-like [Hibiscus syriacus]|uniref:F-box/LRR-repeat protein fbxl-1-like n=1 Tax=Hibiscus syriacus TaxID=106335 RepID=UPI001924FCEB|nr:F-box/LRR-repeat protein fbxl-1-like [Hibiscus syriacus]
MDREAPSLLDLSLRTLAKNADVIVSLDHVPDMLRHKLTRLLCDSRKMDAHFLQLLASGLPEEIRINDCSQVTEDEFTKIFGCCDTNNLTVLQLDLCGSCMPDYVLRDTLACSSKSLPALATLSLNGAHRMTDEGLNMLALSAPALQSINLSHCSLLTSAGINNLANCFESTLRELYLDECHNIEAMVVLPALKKLKCLEVLSMAGIPTVCDDFVIQMVEACGKNMKELVFTNCLELTDVSIKSVGKNCSKLCTIDLSYLSKLTDKSLRYLANGCRSINRLKLIRNRFSDEAIAAFLEASGSDLTELSLNNIALVGLNTALALSKCSRKLFSLDLSWCRHLNDEALGLIVDSCLSLKQLKLFGCTQLTDVFLKGHSNPQVQIIGQELRTVSKFLNVLKPQEPPLRYSPIGRLH